MTDDRHLIGERLGRQVADFAQDTLTGTPWAPPDGGVVVAAVLIVGWQHPDGTYGTCHVPAGAPWATEGLITSALRDIEDPGACDCDL